MPGGRASEGGGGGIPEKRPEGVGASLVKSQKAHSFCHRGAASSLSMAPGCSVNSEGVLQERGEVHL